MALFTASPDESCDTCGRYAAQGQRRGWQDARGEITCPDCRSRESAREAGWVESEGWR